VIARCLVFGFNNVQYCTVQYDGYVPYCTYRYGTVLMLVTARLIFVFSWFGIELTYVYLRVRRLYCWCETRYHFYLYSVDVVINVVVVVPVPVPYIRSTVRLQIPVYTTAVDNNRHLKHTNLHHIISYQ